MNFLLAEAGRRKFHCLYCDGEDPLHSPEIAKLFTGELRPLDWSTGTETSKAASGPSLEKGEGHDLE